MDTPLRPHYGYTYQDTVVTTCLTLTLTLTPPLPLTLTLTLTLTGHRRHRVCRVLPRPRQGLV